MFVAPYGVRFRGLLFASALVLSGAGCVKPSSGGDTRTGEATPAGRAAAGDVAESLAGMGDGAPVVLLLRDGNWTPAPDSVLPRLPFEGIFDAHSRAQALAKLGQWIWVPVEESDFAEVRLNEPVVIATGEVPGARSSATADHDLFGESFGPGRTVVFLPSDNPKKLQAAIEARMGEAQVLSGAAAEPGWTAWMVSRERDRASVVAAIGPWRGGVGIVLLTSGRDLEPQRDAQAISNWLALPEPAPLPDTTAVHLALDTSQPISGVLRPERFGAFFHWAGHRDGRRAVEDAPIDQRNSARFRALTIASTSVAFTRSAEAQTGLWGFALEASASGVEAVAVGDLLEPGRALLEGARLDEVQSWTYLARKPVHMDSNIDFAVLAPKAPAPLHPDLTSELRVRSLGMCGPGCDVNDWAHYPLTTPAKRLAPAAMLDADNERAPLSFSLMARGDSVAVEFAFGLGEHPPPRPKAPQPRPGAAAGPASGPTEVDEACVRNVAAELMRADALFSEPAEKVQAELPKAVRRAFEAAGCDGASPEFQADARMLARWFADASIGWSLAYGEMARARAVANAACEADESSCEAKARFDRVPVVTHLSLTAPACDSDYDFMPGGGTPLTVSKAGVFLGDREVDATPRAIADALADYRLRPTDMESRTDVDGIGLLVEAGMTLGDMRAVLEGFAGVGARTVRAAFRNEKSSSYGGPATDAIWIPFALDVDFSVEPRGRETVYDFEEPPPEPDEEPPPEWIGGDDEEGEEGKMGKPSSKSKSGLYAMRGPDDERRADDEADEGALTLALDRDRVTVSGAKHADTGKPLAIEGRVSKLDELFGELDEVELGKIPHPHYGFSTYGTRWNERELRITVSDKTPWESLVRLAAALCGRAFSLDLND